MKPGSVRRDLLEAAGRFLYPCRAVNWFNAIRASFPNTILYMNNYGGQVGDAQLGDFITRARPDMLSFDTYPWRSDYVSRNPIAGPPTSW